VIKGEQKKIFERYMLKLRRWCWFLCFMFSHDFFMHIYFSAEDEFENEYEFF
jgi:hypothetical protein